MIRVKETIYIVLSHKLLGLIFLFSSISILNYAQEKPPRPIAIFVSPIQGLNFGSFTQGPLGGTVIVYANGSRASTGDAFLLSTGPSWTPALFEIETNLGTLITIVNGPNATLTGSNGGTLTLEIGGSDPVSPFVTIVEYPNRTRLQIGGTLYVGNPFANPEGSYSGSFLITLIQE